MSSNEHEPKTDQPASTRGENIKTAAQVAAGLLFLGGIPTAIGIGIGNAATAHNEAIVNKETSVAEVLKRSATPIHIDDGTPVEIHSIKLPQSTIDTLDDYTDGVAKSADHDEYGGIYRPTLVETTRQADPGLLGVFTTGGPDTAILSSFPEPFSPKAKIYVAALEPVQDITAKVLNDPDYGPELIVNYGVNSPNTTIDFVVYVDYPKD